MRRIQGIFSVITIAAATLVACGGGSSSPAVRTAALSGLTVSAPAAPASVDEGDRLQLSATARWSDNTTTDVTSLVSWTDNTAGAAVRTTGLMTTMAVSADTDVLVTASYTVDNVTFADNVTVTVKNVPTSVSTVAGQAGVGGWADNADLAALFDGTGSAAHFDNPNGLASDGIFLYVADTETHTVRRVDPSTGAGTGVVTTFAGRKGVPGSADGDNTVNRLDTPHGVAFAGDNLYISQWVSPYLRTANAASRVLATPDLSALGIAPGSNGHSVLPSKDNAYLFLSFENPGQILKVKLADWTTAWSLPLPAADSNPEGMALSDDGATLYFTDKNYHCIYKADGADTAAPAAPVLLAGIPGTQGTDAGAPGTATFNNPKRLVLSGDYLFVTDSDNHAVRKVLLVSDGTNPAGYVPPEPVAGLVGTPGSDDGDATTARFAWPTGLAFQDGALYVVDGDNHTIRKIKGY
jgi:hypothetical protein